jgi:protein-S-isoprenylcysteine O-methyltransferase Ste14
MSLKTRVIVQCAGAFGVAAALLFLPAGTLNFWEAWVFLGMVFLPMFIFCAYFYEHDPVMVERRLQRRENVKEQKLIMKMTNLTFVAAFLIPGLDHRFGWTRNVAGVIPLWLRIVAQALVLAGYLFTFWVIDVNRFASRTIRVEPGQKVISAGPYRWVRHPMYFGALVMWLAVAPALGSYVALPFFALLVPVIVYRLLNEEKLLRQELPGYDAYCRKTRFRLVPYVW